MEVLIGHANRHMLKLLTNGALFCTKQRLIQRKLLPMKIGRFHSNVAFQDKFANEHTFLTVSNLELKGKYKWKKNDKFSPRDVLKPVTSSPTAGVKLAENKISENGGVPETVSDSPTAKSFSELNLSPLLVERLEKEHFTVPTDVQSAAIPTISQKHDVVIQSYTGSGKTFAYLLPILSELGPLRNAASGEQPDKRPGIEAVIVAPSRELGMQIVREIERLLGPGDKKFVQQLVGGANRSRQEEALKKNKPGIVVGTPGRIAEISAAGKLHTHSCRFLILDEIDQLLSFNFREDMHRILEHVGRRSGGQKTDILGPLTRRAERQLVMVSATVPFSVMRAARSWGRNPLLVKGKMITSLDSVPVPHTGQVNLDPDATSSPGSMTQAAKESLPPALKHYYCVTKLQHKVDTVRRCIHALDAKSVIVFMNHVKRLKDVVFKLEARGIKADELHGDLGKLARSTTLQKFREGELRVLVTNELSARGLDVAQCDLVVNLDLPTDSVHYAHRAGRAGRLGRKGNVVTICEEPEAFVIKKLQRQLGLPINSCEIREGKLVVREEEEKVEKAEAAR